MKKTLTALALAGSLALSGCGNNEPIRGVIQSESFYSGFQRRHNDRYTTIIETLDGERISTFNYEEDARTLDLEYGVGDTVQIRKHGPNSGSIVNPFR